VGVVVVVVGDVVVLSGGGGGTTVVLGSPLGPVTVIVCGACEVGGCPGDGPVSTCVAVSVTVPLLPLPLVSVMARPPMASSTAAAAAPNRMGGRLYHGSGPGTGSPPGESSCFQASARKVADAAPSEADSDAANPAAPAAQPAAMPVGASAAAASPVGAIPVGASASSARSATNAAPAATLNCDCGVVTTGVRSRSDSCWVTSGMLAPPPTVATADKLATGMLLRCNVSSMVVSRP